jgi:acyl dehydratase
MAEESLITEEARAMIGKESPPRLCGEVYQKEINRFCQAMGDLNPLYIDEEYASKTRYGGIIAPHLFYWIFGYDRADIKAPRREDGIQITEEIQPPLKTSRTMGAGCEVEFANPIRLGDVLTATTRITDIYEREGRSGKMVFTLSETTYRNQRGEIVVIDKSISMSRP